MASFQVQAISVPLLLPNRQTVYRGVQTKTNTAVYQGNFTNTVWERVWPLPPQGEGQIPFAYVIDVAQPLSISLGAIFVPTPQWADQNSGGGFYMVELRSGDNLVLRSDPQIVQPAVDVDAFKFVQPGQILGPFKSGTQWTASIICCNAGGLPAESIQPLQDEADIRLEAYFFIGDLHFLFRKGDQLGHRLEIIRNTVMDAGQHALVHNTDQYKQAATAHIAESIWSHMAYKLFYDNRHGAGRTGVGGYGGAMSLSLALPNTWNRTNCYDLAAITQAWCASLGEDSNADPVLETVWGYSGEWFGYVTEGPLFGWSINLGQWMRCNNPFFGSSGNVYYNAAGLHDVARQPFGNHAWVEVVTGQGAPLALRVIEVCHAKYDPNNVNNPTICKGNINRGTWLQGAVNSGALTNALKGQWDPVLIDQLGRGYRLKPPPPGVVYPRYYNMKPGSQGLQEIYD